jgi:hypothetical protein
VTDFKKHSSSKNFSFFMLYSLTFYYNYYFVIT